MKQRTELLQKDKLLRDFPANAQYLVAVSGGRDSVALLHSLVISGYKKLVVCHLNHQLRGRAAAADARFVEKLAAKHGLEVKVGHANVRAVARRRKISIETAAREARYSFFSKVAEATECHTIFLGHHADDLVETVLLNLFRGAGAGGLIGIRAQAIHQVGNVDLTVVRPLLHVWRRDINHYVQKTQLDFCEDASNSDLGPLRNRIRRRIIPYLEKTMGRRIRQNIWKTANILGEEEKFFDAMLPNRVSAQSLTVRPLRQVGVAVQRRMLHDWLRAAEVPDITFELVERVRGLLDLANDVHKTNLPGDRYARRRAGKLFLE